MATGELAAQSRHVSTIFFWIFYHMGRRHSTPSRSLVTTLRITSLAGKSSWKVQRSRIGRLAAASVKVCTPYSGQNRYYATTVSLIGVAL